MSVMNSGPKSTLFLHCGAREVSVESLRFLPVPEETRTYKPISHWDLVNTVKRVAEEKMPNLNLVRAKYGLTKDNLRLFGVHTYHVEGYNNEGLSVAFRQGLDRIVPVSGCAGQQTFVCDNMAMSGDEMFLRRHTGEGLQEKVENLFGSIMDGGEEKFKCITAETETMRDVEMDDDRAWELTGLLEGRGIVNQRSKKVIMQDWVTPRYEEFAGRNLYSYYNCLTQGLKHLPATNLIDAHSRAHKTLVERCL